MIFYYLKKLGKKLFMFQGFRRKVKGRSINIVHNEKFTLLRNECPKCKNYLYLEESKCPKCKTTIFSKKKGS